MERDIVVLTDENGADVRFDLLDIVDYRGADYAVLLPADEDADMFTILRSEPDPDAPEDCLLIGIDDQKTVDAVYQKFQQRHPEWFSEG